ncbi:MAG: hypothetical protein HQK64_07500 [Desulfamplus sp.]|nr:hypothetical protein [Desulfamplus sp.]MBF0389480.1 hypothetical protein [Desulfamplus sp.]
MNEQLNEELTEESIEIFQDSTVEDESSMGKLNDDLVEILQGDSIDIVALDTQSLEPAAKIRKSFRIPIRKKGSVCMIIHGSSFPVEDINAKGSGILMVEDHSFFNGQLLSDCQLVIEEDKFNSVECQIVHISYTQGSQPILGVKWLNMDNKMRSAKGKQIEDICSELKSNLLKESVDDTDENID